MRERLFVQSAYIDAASHSLTSQSNEQESQYTVRSIVTSVTKQMSHLSHCVPCDAKRQHRSVSTLLQIFGLFPDDTKPLPEQMPTYHERCHVAFI